MLNNLDIWFNNFKSLTKNNNNNIDLVLSEFLDKEVNGLLTLEFISHNQTFFFNKEIFKFELSALKNYDDSKIPMLLITNAWETAILSSNWIVLPGIYILPLSTPASIYSIVNPIIIEPSSLMIAKENLLNSLLTLNNQNDSKAFLKCFRDSFLMLKYTVSGLNSLVPTPSPLLINSNVV